jgi:hypothetical protein
MGLSEMAGLLGSALVLRILAIGGLATLFCPRNEMVWQTKPMITAERSSRFDDTDFLPSDDLGLWSWRSLSLNDSRAS